jgi:UDP-N-acetylmuramate--alanine ligase
MKLSDIKKAHFIGVGGIGMSALARLFLHEKKLVSGSDRSPSDITKSLEAEGVHFFPAQVRENITDDIDLVVYTEAMAKDHEELAAARKKKIPIMNYFEALGMVANEYYLIAVAGSHGKTTTTAMLIDIFEEAGLDPTAIVGSLRAKTKSNYRAGKSKYFIVEACEYRRDFMSLKPDILVITNIELEHVDYYKTLDDVQAAFRELSEKVPETGAIIANLKDDKVRPCIEGVSAKIIDYSAYFNPLRRLMVPGVHNQLNAAAAVAAAAQVGIKPQSSDAALMEFAGTWRRFEYKGEVNGAKVYDDYGHHPTEIKATIKGARELYPDRNLILVFQSHTYTRTHCLFDDFVDALGMADYIIVLPIYAARETNENGVTHVKLVDALISKEKQAVALETFDEVLTQLRTTIGPEDLVLIMGAGDITKVAQELTAVTPITTVATI